MAFGRRKNQSDTGTNVTLPNVQPQQAAGNTPTRSPIMRLLANLLMLVLAVGVLVGLFFGWRWVYANIRGDNTTSDTATQNEGQNDKATDQGASGATDQNKDEGTPAAAGDDAAQEEGSQETGDASDIEPAPGDTEVSENGQLVASGPNDVALIAGVVIMSATAHYAFARSKYCLHPNKKK